MIQRVYRAFFAAFLIAATSPAQAAPSSAEPVEGREFVEIFGGKPASDAPGVEVAELFWYGCPHCYRAEPDVHEWLKRKPDHARFERIPMLLNAPAIEHAKAFYTAAGLGIEEKMHLPLFRALQVQRKRMTDPAEIQGLFQSVAGVTPEQFHAVFDSFEVDGKVRRTQVLASEWGVNSVPTVIVGGRYRTSGSMAGTYKRMMEVVDHLVERVHAEDAAEAAQTKN
ncbi:MAG: thiol:disulfide interchange protein DsbA/DsbL [Chromatiales bacterium]|nr:thiol:disulfide interchange protein DsbA/DsbL [Chromatiales bacterium]